MISIQQWQLCLCTKVIFLPYMLMMWVAFLLTEFWILMFYFGTKSRYLSRILPWVVVPIGHHTGVFRLSFASGIAGGSGGWFAHGSVSLNKVCAEFGIGFGSGGGFGFNGSAFCTGLLIWQWWHFSTSLYHYLCLAIKLRLVPAVCSL